MIRNGKWARQGEWETVHGNSGGARIFRLPGHSRGTRI